MNIECCKKHLRFINPNGAMIYCSFFWLFSPCANIDCKSSDWRILFLWSVCCFLMLQYKWCDWASFCHIAYSEPLLSCWIVNGSDGALHWNLASCDWLVLTVTSLWQTSLTGIVLCRWLHTLGRWKIGQRLHAKTGADNTHVQVVNIGMSYTSLCLLVVSLFVFSVAFYFHFLGLLVMVVFLVKQKIHLVCLEKIILLCRLSTWWLFHVRSTLLTGVVFCRIHGCKSFFFWEMGQSGMQQTDLQCFELTDLCGGRP